MKKIFIAIVLSTLFVGLSLTSCYEDDTTLDLNKIPVLQFKDKVNRGVTVFQQGTIKIEPKLVTEFSEGKTNVVLIDEVYRPEYKVDLDSVLIDESKLSFEWKIYTDYNGDDCEVISQEKNLEYIANLVPSPDKWNPYFLLLTITDDAIDIQYTFKVPIVVSSIIGEGVIISETKDGLSCDLSLIMSPEVSKDFGTTKILRNLYSTENEANIDGIVTGLFDSKFDGKQSLIALTENSISTILNSNIEFRKSNDELFSNHSGAYKPSTYATVSNHSGLVVDNNNLYFAQMGFMPQFPTRFDYSYKVPKHLAVNKWANYFSSYVNFYDESTGKFIYVKVVPNYWAPQVMYECTAVSDGVFNPASVPNKTVLGAGASKFDKTFMHILKDNTSGEIGLYVFDGTSANGPEPMRFMDLSSAPEIENAVKFDFCDDQKVIYYYVGSKIYGIAFAGETAFTEEKFAFPSGEEITTLQVFQQAGYQTAFPSKYYPTTNKMLVVSTYSDQGKVYYLPMKDTGLGNIDAENTTVHEGFDKITAIAIKS